MTSEGAADEEVIDSLTGWVAKHIRGYVESDGRKGHRWHGAPTLLLTTRGRKSGQLRRTALIYGRDGDDYLVVGSNGGRPNHPAWYLNLRDDPEVTLQVGPEVFPARARTATPQEKPHLWRHMAQIWSDYDAYQKKATREIPVVILSPHA